MAPLHPPIWPSLAFVVAAQFVGGCCYVNQPSDRDPTPIVNPPPTTPTHTVTPQPGTKNPPVTVTATPPPTTPAPTAAPTNEYQGNGFPKAMPTSRTAVPTMAEWNNAPLVTTKPVPNGCSMKFVREWLKIHCENPFGPTRISGQTNVGVTGSDYFEYTSAGRVIDAIFRTQDNRKATARFTGNAANGTWTVGYDWPHGAPFPSTVFTR